MTEVPGKTVTAEHSLPPFELRLECNELAVRDALAAVLRKLAPLNLAPEEKGTIEIVLAEVLNNIVEHAYPADTVDGLIEISCTYQEGGLNLKIVDNGKKLPDGKLPSGNLASLNMELSELPEGGFGWFMIHNLSKSVTYSRTSNQNVLNLRLAVGTGS